MILYIDNTELHEAYNTTMVVNPLCSEETYMLPCTQCYSYVTAI